MASYSLSGYRKGECNGNTVLALAVDGKAVFCFIGWMQHTRPEMLGLETYGSAHMLEMAKALAGAPMNRSYRVSRFVPAMIEGDFAKQQTTARNMAQTRAAETRTDYLVKLQTQAAHYVMRASGCRHMLACRDESQPLSSDAPDWRAMAIEAQERACDAFRKSADVRGLFDTPTMDDSHAVECEVSRVESASAIASFETFAAKYRERAFNAYGRYAMYCARAGVAPYAFPEWFADCYAGHESDPAANWN